MLHLLLSFVQRRQEAANHVPHHGHAIVHAVVDNRNAVSDATTRESRHVRHGGGHTASGQTTSQRAPTNWCCGRKRGS